MRFFDGLDKKYLKVSLYVIGTFVGIMAAFQLINNIVPVFNWLWGIISFIFAVLQPVLIGFAIAYLIKPVVVFYTKQLEKVKWKFVQKKAHRLGVLCAILSVLIFLTGITSLLVYSVTEQIRIANMGDITIFFNNLIGNVNDLYREVNRMLTKFNIETEGLLPHAENIASTLFTGIQNWLSGLVQSITNFSGHFVNVLVSMVIAIYLMVDGEMVAKLLDRISRVIFSKRMNDKIRELLADLDTSFSGYIRGQLMDVLFMMVAISFTLLLTGVRFPFLIGILAGLGNLVPFAGPFIAYALTLIVSIINGEYQVLLVSMIALSVIQFVDGNIVAPRLMSHSIKIHPLLVMCFLIAGSAFGGLLGMLLAVPVGGFCKLVFMKWLEGREKRVLEDTEN